MKKPVLAFAAAAVLSVGLAAPALAAPVNEQTFTQKVNTLVKTATTPANGKAVSTVSSATAKQNGKTVKMVMSSTVNPDGSSVSSSNFPMPMESRCLSAKDCYTSVDGGKTWSADMNGPSGLNFNPSGRFPAGSTFDITGGTYTAKQGGTSVVITSTGGVLTMTSTQTTGGQTGTATVTVKKVAPVKVVKPAKSKIGM